MKYKVKRFTKILITKTKDEEGKWKGATPKNIEDLTDSQLYNLSRYDKDIDQQRAALKKYKKNREIIYNCRSTCRGCRWETYNWR